MGAMFMASVDVKKIGLDFRSFPREDWGNF